MDKPVRKRAVQGHWKYLVTMHSSNCDISEGKRRMQIQLLKVICPILLVLVLVIKIEILKNPLRYYFLHFGGGSLKY